MTTPVERVINHLITVSELKDSIRGPGWFEALCEVCGWYRTGTDYEIKDFTYDHVAADHSELVKIVGVAFERLENADKIRFRSLELLRALDEHPVLDSAVTHPARELARLVGFPTPPVVVRDLPELPQVCDVCHEHAPEHDHVVHEIHVLRHAASRIMVMDIGCFTSPTVVQSDAANLLDDMAHERENNGE